jgi:predicted nuclease of predicted toxin-antitoxin system
VTELFVRLYLDENLPIVLAPLIHARGFFATTAHAEGRLSASDADHLRYAASHGYCLVTHNRQHFIQLHSDTLNAGQTHAGIIIAVVHDVYTLANRLAERLNTITADEMAN